MTLKEIVYSKRRRKSVKLKYRIRNNLLTISYTKPWKQAIQQRIPTTAQWLQQESLFCKE